MQTPIHRKKTHSPRSGRLLLALLLLLALAATLTVWRILSQQTTLPEVETVSDSGVLYTHATEDVARLDVTLSGQETWTVVQTTAGSLTLQGADGFVVEDASAASLLSAASVVAYEEVLLEDDTEIQASLDEFGLAEPAVVAAITYTDGTTVTVTIGDSAPLEDETWYFMQVSGDKRLFALDKGTAEAYMVDAASLHPVTQPTLHKARFDRITFLGEDGEATAEWTLGADVLDSDVSSAWYLTVPYRYPADKTTLANLRTNLSNLRLGAYVCEATPETLEEYGLTAPSFTVVIHMAAGTIGTTDASGVYSTTAWPESTFTLAMGRAKNDSVDYVLCEGSIYLTSHYSLQTFLDIAPLDTVSRYPIPVELDDLASLTIAEDGAEPVAYVLTREPQVAANNDLVTDSDGNVVYDISCTRNGAALAYSTFEGAWEQFYAVKVTGALPQGSEITAAVRATYTFVTTTGRTYTLQLAPYDALHDAVLLDGTALFYLIRDGLRLDLGV